MSREIYCEIVGKAIGLFKNKVEIKIDFGQEKVALVAQILLPILLVK